MLLSVGERELCCWIALDCEDKDEDEDLDVDLVLSVSSQYNSNGLRLYMMGFKVDGVHIPFASFPIFSSRLVYPP